MVWSSWLQPASAAAAVRANASGVRVIIRHCAGAVASVKIDGLHCPEAGHSLCRTMVDNAGTSAQRIRIGLTGLAFAFLLVLLGSVISRSGSDERAANAVEQAAANTPSEPLAELGVAPGGAESQANNSSDTQ